MAQVRKIRRRSERGQGITEYAAILAFVAGIIAMVYMFVPGNLAPALSSSFSSVVSSLNSLISGS